MTEYSDWVNGFISLVNGIPQPVLFLLFSAVAVGFVLGLIKLAYQNAGLIILGFLVYWLLSSAG